MTPTAAACHGGLNPASTPDPYGVWLSEIMLQQTTVPAVIPYFRKFLARWPTVESLAQAPLEEILREWAGLGYYARARNLHACAKEIVGAHDGRFPQSSGDLRKLPGIGPYTAAAIAAIAFDERAAAVDGNAERVIARLFAIETVLPHAKTEIGAAAMKLVPARRPGDFAQALMDLGAAICTPKSPNCLLCPWMHRLSGAATQAIAQSLPRKALRPSKTPAPWDRLLDRARRWRRPSAAAQGQGALGRHDGGSIFALGSRKARWLARSTASKPTGARMWHASSTASLIFIWCSTSGAPLMSSQGELLEEGDYRWVACDRLGEEALPSVMRKIVGAVLGQLDCLLRHSGESRNQLHFAGFEARTSTFVG